MALEKFDILEKKVNLLAEKYAKLKSERENIIINSEQNNKKLLELEEKIRFLEEEKEIIKSRLDKIISNLENIPLNF